MQANQNFYLNQVNLFTEVIKNCQVTNAEGNVEALEKSLTAVVDMLNSLRTNKSDLYIIGNGGSASVASHAVIDFLNVGKIKAHVMHESPVITCMANDYGFENCYSQQIPVFLDSKSMLIAISSIGNSRNICNAVQAAKNAGSTIITLSGFSEKNTLRSMGILNFYLNSSEYGMVEVGHQFILHNLADRIRLQMNVHLLTIIKL